MTETHFIINPIVPVYGYKFSTTTHGLEYSYIISKRGKLMSKIRVNNGRKIPVNSCEKELLSELFMHFILKGWFVDNYLKYEPKFICRDIIYIILQR